ncbi:hypothetical protein POJ06DRAFT_120410 [Lipomyces tetrasporus]|uniref:Golgi apparatus membrane protein TVP38 n=1 Tax=Lipomyces tetrasporus TaxID=54092 RepID=A0AAD7VS47_9ASCO|nr:uncharacterized protein POJ06DRAFT_120410 [Lipomyces tetrasporus]KAJ8099953.1 hypothetical protein POJ06DRAFT_120410 [Lipomyces tetrasporus]
MAAHVAQLAQEEADLLILPPPVSTSVPDFRNPSLLRQRIREYVDTIPVRQKLFGGALLVILGTLALLLLIFHQRIFGFIVPICESWSNMRGGVILLFLLISVTSFPPVVGYTSAVTIAGMIYGFWEGWLVAAITTPIASYCCFVACRAFFADFAHDLATNNRNFEALAFTLEHDGLKLLWMIRMSPLPFSFSNAALSTIHTITPRNFFIATVLSTPKLFIPVFIGSRLRSLGDENADFGTKIANLFGIAVGACVAATAGWIIYQRTTERAQYLRAQLERQQELRDEPLRAPSASRPSPPDLVRGLEFARLGNGTYRDEPENDNDDSDDEFHGDQSSASKIQSPHTDLLDGDGEAGQMLVTTEARPFVAQS